MPSWESTAKISSLLRWISFLPIELFIYRISQRSLESHSYAKLVCELVKPTPTQLANSILLCFFSLDLWTLGIRKECTRSLMRVWLLLYFRSNSSRGRLNFSFLRFVMIVACLEDAIPIKISQYYHYSFESNNNNELTNQPTNSAKKRRTYISYTIQVRVP